MAKHNPVSALDFPVASGVYLLKHRATGDSYVGSSANLRKRIYRWIWQIRIGRAPKRFSDLCANSGSRFDMSILELAPPAKRKSVERKWMRKLRPTLNFAKMHSDPLCNSRRCAVALTIDPALVAEAAKFSDAKQQSLSLVFERAIRKFLELRGKLPKSDRDEQRGARRPR